MSDAMITAFGLVEQASSSTPTAMLQAVTCQSGISNVLAEIYSGSRFECRRSMLVPLSLSYHLLVNM